MGEEIVFICLPFSFSNALCIIMCAQVYYPTKKKEGKKEKKNEVQLYVLLNINVFYGTHFFFDK